MRRAARWLVWTLAAVVALPLLAVAVLLIGLNTGPGRHLAARLTARVTGGQVTLAGIGGRFPDALRVARIELRDSQGVWLTVEDAALDWAPSRLLAGEAAVSRLDAARVAVARLPVAEPESATPSGGGSFSLLVRVDVAALHVGRLELAAAVAGAGAVLAADGHAHVASLQDGSADLTLRRLDGDGRYHATGRIDAAGLSASVTADEPAHGLISQLATLPDLGALTIRATANGPWTGAATQVNIAAGPLRAEAHGQVNIDGMAADLDLAATAPAMTPRPDIAWQAVALEAHVHGPFRRPQAKAHLRLDGLAAAGAGVRRLVADVTGDLGQLALTASAEGISLPGPHPDLLAASPLTLTADARLDAPDRPVTFTLAHKLLSLAGSAQTGGAIQARAHLDLPDLAPLAAAGGVDVQGHAAFDLTAALGTATALTLDGTLGVSDGMAPLPGLLGPDTRLGVTAALHGADVTLSRLTLDGRAVSLTAQGGLTGGAARLDWTVALPDLSVLAPAVQGAVQAHGKAHGPTTDLAAQADITGEVATTGVPRGPINLSLTAAGLPDAPTGHVLAEGTLDGAKLALDAAVARQADGTTTLAITRADWKSAHAEGALALAPHAALPTGKLALRMDRLDDLRRLLGQPLGGAVSASLDLSDTAGHGTARLSLAARDAGLPGAAQVGRATLAATVLDPAGDPDVTATLDVDGLQAGGISGDMRASARGRQAALALGVQAALRGVAGAELAASAKAVLDVPGQRVAVSALQADWKGEALRLLDPVRVSFGDGISLDRARLGLREAVLEVAGRVTPTLDLTASLRNVSADLLQVVAPGTQAEGALNAEAKLGGTPQRPTGTIRLAATGLRLRDGPAASLPPGALTLEATLAGATARVQARVSEGRNEITLAGTAPIDPAAAMALQARGDVDLAVLDPLLSAQGRQVRGRITLDTSIGGTTAAPRVQGQLRLSGGDVQDLAQGAHVSHIEALIEASGDTLRISRFSGQAGKGSLGATGSMGLAGAMPVDLHLTAKHASPLSSDRLTATFDMDLALRGEAMGALGVSGDIKIDRADIRIPDKLPAKVAVLDVVTPGEAPPPAATGPAIALDVTLTAPGQVFVRGRGLFAELQGRIHITGTAAAPQPLGKFELRRGEFNLAGVALTFTTGEVGFDGSGKLDPTLNFVATSNNGNIVANLNITGTASAPKITLSSTPELPQDEVLAQLLFHQSASTLSAVQLASAAAALAQISGATGSFDPLNSLRQGLGLDRLSVGGAQNGNGAAVEAGRYVAKGVYVGAKQDTSGQGTQATVQIDLMKGLKLETSVATGGSTSATGAASTTDPSGTTVGLTYHFDY